MEVTYTWKWNWKPLVQEFVYVHHEGYCTDRHTFTKTVMIDFLAFSDKWFLTISANSSAAFQDFLAFW